MPDARFAPSYLGIAVKKGNKPLLDRINAGLKAVIGSGDYGQIHLKRFGSSAPALPATVPN